MLKIYLKYKTTMKNSYLSIELLLVFSNSLSFVKKLIKPKTLFTTKRLVFSTMFE